MEIESKGENDQPDNQGPRGDNKAAALAPNTDPAIECANHPKGNDRWIIRAKPWIEGVALLAGVVLVGLTYCQWRTMREQMALDSRAWVAPVDFEGHPEVGKSFYGRFKIKNTGKTFAINVRLVSNYAAGGKNATELDYKSLIESAAKKEKREGFLLPPNANTGSDIKIDDGKILTESDVKRINDGDYVVMVFGRISYDDVFGCQHWTTFCYRYDRRETESFWYAHGEYNKADENTCP